MSTLKLTATVSKFIPATIIGGGCSFRAFVTAAKPLQCKKNEDSSEQAKEAAESVKHASDAISENVKKVSGKVSETVDVVKEKAKEMMSFGAAKVATEVIKKKKEMENGENNKNKK